MFFNHPAINYQIQNAEEELHAGQKYNMFVENNGGKNKKENPKRIAQHNFQ